jgi:transposase
MSVLSITPFYSFCRVKLCGQEVTGNKALLYARPDQRFKPRCNICKGICDVAHSWEKRSVRDLNCGAVTISVLCHYRKVLCTTCNRIRVEAIDFFEPYQRVTKRLALYIHELCKMLTVQDVAKHLNLDWKTVKNIDKSFLEEKYSKTDYTDLTVLAVDEIAVKKGHSYMTVVLDYITGRVIWMADERKAETLMKFFEDMPKDQLQKLTAIAMDMWDPFIKAVREKAPHVQIVFDLFHMVKEFNKVIDHVRLDEYRKASDSDKQVIQGSKYLLLKNRENIRIPQQIEHLEQLLTLNKTISQVMILKDKLKMIWSCSSRHEAELLVNEWCDLANAVSNPFVEKFINRIRRYSYGILNHCDHPIHTSILEGVNNKIKLIKRKAYGFHDQQYFSFKVIQAFSTN